jgi:putative salt-induced outer membrane protein YdiY
LADQVTLQNGDRLTGEVVKSDGKTLCFKSEFAGTVEIPWKAVQALVSDKPIFVQTAPEQPIYSGAITVDETTIAVKREAGPVQQVERKDVTALRSVKEQVSYERLLYPGLLQGWKGGANFGFALTRGNSETRNLALAFSAARTSFKDKFSVYANSVYATNDSPDAPSAVTANAIQGGLRYDRNIQGTRLFGFVSGDFMTDELQALEIRSVTTGGIGDHLVKRERVAVDLFAGINYTRENYTEFSRDLAGATLGEEFMHKFGAGTVLTQKLYFYPNLSETGEYRGTFDLSAVTKLNKWLGWQTTFSNIYVSNPPEGKVNNDLLFTTGLSFSFAR